MESFELGSEKLQNFILHDKIDVERSNEWRFRLPWPLFDMTSVKIPVLSNTVKLGNKELFGHPKIVLILMKQMANCTWEMVP